MEGARKVIMPLLSEVAVESSLLLVYQINKSEMEWTSLKLFLGSSSLFFLSPQASVYCLQLGGADLLHETEHFRAK